jgi:RecJ-like exonuclease
MNRKKAQAGRFEHEWCRKCGGSGKINGVCRLCKGDGKVRTTLCLCCDRKMVMDHEFDKVCPNCKCRQSDYREPYRVIFG